MSLGEILGSVLIISILVAGCSCYIVPRIKDLMDASTIKKQPKSTTAHIKHKGIGITCHDLEKLKEIKKNIDTWIVIYEDKKCPECGAKDSMLQGPIGGLSINIMCKRCDAKFWVGPAKAIGAYKI